MTRSYRIANLFFIFLFLVVPGFAQESSDSTIKTDKKIRPVEVSFTTLGGLSYSLDGNPLRDYKEFEAIVDPLRDFEASRLLRKSESSDGTAKIFRLVGLAGFATGLVGILTASSSQQTPFWLTGAGGAVVINIGGLFETEAQTTKFNCVQRYNRFARGEEQVLPEGPQNEKSLLNFDNNK